MRNDFWRGRKVFVTGHTGFKGSWLSLWLKQLGAEVFGFSTEPPTSPNLFTAAGVSADLSSHVIGDVRDAVALASAIHSAAPEIVFHLAAQPLVRHSYNEPVETYAVNVLGTVNLLESIRRCNTVRAVVNVTTDKCYENREWMWGYRETESLGGRDPYSSSKACSELVTAAYRASFLASRNIGVATARAGNVIGGGDWAADRLIPDFFRAFSNREVLAIRSPNATRPWQHVLEPLSGYLQLAESLACGDSKFADAWNFGPNPLDVRSVRWLLEYLSGYFPSARWEHVAAKNAHEAHSLALDSSKANTVLGWSGKWSIEQALDHTANWYLSWNERKKMRDICLDQIAQYESAESR